MAGARPPVSQHDAEEAMRPLLRDVFETNDAMVVPVHDAATGAYIRALALALEGACKLLGVQG